MPRSLVQVYLHCVWATLRREPAITLEWEPLVYSSIRHEAEKSGCRVLAIGGVEDHVHLLVQLSPLLSTAVLMKQVKGATSRLTNSMTPHYESLHWQEGYGAFSVSPSHRTKIRTM